MVVWKALVGKWPPRAYPTVGRLPHVISRVDNRMRLPGVAIAYIVVVICGGIALVAMYALSSGVGWPSPEIGSLELALSAVFFTTAAFLADMYPIAIPSTRILEVDRDGNELVLSSSVYVASLLLFGPAFTIGVAASSVLLSDLWRRKPLLKAAFNCGQYVVTVGISGLFLLNTGTNPHSFQPWVSSLEGVATLVLTLFTYFLFNTSLVAGVVGMTQGARYVEVWTHANRQILTQYVGMLNVGLVAAILWTVSPPSLVLLALPLGLVHLASKAVSRLKLETAQALVSIAGMVDSRDSYAYRHSQDVARYATQIAVKMGLPLDQVEEIKLGAQLHDIGKIGTPDAVLFKPGRLSDEERAVMEEHPSVGARVLQYFSQFRSGSAMVLHHQEHYDGTGYPARLAGDHIPQGARIIHVADAYQAMTSDRVYRKAMDPNEAVRRLLEGSGSQFDPAVVEAFLAVLQDSGVPLEPSVVEARLTPSLSLSGSR